MVIPEGDKFLCLWVFMWSKIFVNFETVQKVAKIKEKQLVSKETSCFRGAAGRIRTADLILTKDALYLLSYSSINGDPERARTVDL